MEIEMQIPERSNGVPGGPYSEGALFSLISRIPVGEQAGLPSLLDFACATGGHLQSSWLDWEIALADHAALFMTLAGSFSAFQARPRRTWRCRDNDGLNEWMRSMAPESFTDINGLHSFLLEAQTNFADTRTASQRRRCREPNDIKELRARLRAATEEPARMRLQRLLLETRKQFLKGLRQER